jgi:hypothetical protein
VVDVSIQEALLLRVQEVVFCDNVLLAIVIPSIYQPVRFLTMINHTCAASIFRNSQSCAAGVPFAIAVFAAHNVQY